MNDPDFHDRDTIPAPPPDERTPSVTVAVVDDGTPTQVDRDRALDRAYAMLAEAAGWGTPAPPDDADYCGCNECVTTIRSAPEDASGEECWLCSGLGAEVSVPSSWYAPAEYATCAACGGTGRN